MFRMKHYTQSNQHLQTVDAQFAVTDVPASAMSTYTATDLAWEFGWSFDGGEWLRRRESPPMQLSSLDKALALAG